MAGLDFSDSFIEKTNPTQEPLRVFRGDSQTLKNWRKDNPEKGFVTTDATHTAKLVNGEYVFTRALGKRKAPPILGGFPKELTPSNIQYPNPCTEFDKTPPKYDPTQLVIYVTPSQSFTVMPKDIFSNELKHNNSKEAYKWLSGPSMDYYSQQLAFALWCATAGCGIGYDMLNKYTPMINSLLRFHVIFTCRRILAELGAPLPNDSAFKDTNNKWSKNGYDKICRELNVQYKDFRFTAGENGGLGRIYKDMFGVIHDVTIAYNEQIGGKKTNQWPNGYFFFNDQGGSWGNHELAYMTSLQKKPHQFFMLNESKGLTSAGLSRLNQSIEAFVYCVIGSQVRNRSTIVGTSGSAQETQTVFLKLFESAIIESDISKSIQRYQMATQDAKQRLTMAVAVGCWLLPSNLIINSEVVNGYNNKLLRATSGMKFGINNVNNDHKLVPTFGHPSKHVGPQEPVVRTPTVPRVKTVEPDDHMALKVGLSVASIGLGYYVMR